MENHEKGLYMYCLVANNEGIDKELQGIAGMDIRYPLFTIPSGGLCAVVSLVNLSEFGDKALLENMEDIQWVKDKAWRHEEIVERIMVNRPVLPFNLCNIFLDPTKVVKMLEEKYSQFLSVFNRLKDKQEWALKVYCDERLLSKVIEKEYGNGGGLTSNGKSQPGPPSAGKAYLMRRQMKGMLAQKTRERALNFAQNIFGILSEKAEESCVNKASEFHKTENGIALVLNAAFLLKQDKLEEFLSSVKDLNQARLAEGFELQCSGPWPAYNFIKLSNKEKSGHVKSG